MSEHDDDLARWADDDLVRALRAPGTTAELAEQEHYVAAFREARGPSAQVRTLPRRAAGRLGAGGTAVVLTVALTSGVAAAYTGHLPDPVQQIAHSVIGAPAPEPGTTHAGSGPGRHGHGVPPRPSGSAPTTAPPGAPTSGTTPGSAPTTGSTQPGSGSSPAGSRPSTGPSAEPTATSTPTATVGTPGGMTAVGLTHTVGVGETVTLSSTLTTLEGTVLPDYPVVLQVRDDHQWQSVAQTTTDATGAATATTAPITRSTRFRWHTDHHIHSTLWRVQMVPTVSATADVGGQSTTVTATTQGGNPGDRVQLLRRANHHASPIAGGTLDTNGSVSFTVGTPPRRGAVVVRLLPTPAHTAAHVRVQIVPPVAASVSIAATTSRVLVGGSLTVSGIVRAADGSGLAGRQVRLQVRGAKRWLGAGSATTDASGAVALTTPAARRTVHYRLRTGNGLHSTAVRVVMVPTLGVTWRADGAQADVVANAFGGHPGDRIALLRRMGGRLVKVQSARLAADGTAAFTVAHRKRSTTYVVRLLATPRHAVATARTTVAGTG